MALRWSSPEGSETYIGMNPFKLFLITMKSTVSSSEGKYYQVYSKTKFLRGFDTLKQAKQYCEDLCR